MKQASKLRPERNWVEICCFGCSCLQLFWPRVVMRKWLNISPRDSDYSADTDEGDDIASDSETEEFFECGNGIDSRFRGIREEDPRPDLNDDLPRSRRRNSETFRAQYISTKELRICVGTWNVGGKVPPEDLDIDDWIDINEPADIYVFGFQEIVPLNAGNIFGAEDNRPVPKWENIIRETLARIRPATARVKCYSDPSSPTKFKPFDDLPNLEEEIILESESDFGEEIYPLDEDPNGFDEVNNSAGNKSVFSNYGVSHSNDVAKVYAPVEQDTQNQFSSPKMLDGLNCLQTENCAESVEDSVSQQNRKFTRTLSGIEQNRKLTRMLTGIEQNRKLTRMLSGTERIGLSWPEPPLHLLSQKVLDRPSSFKLRKPFRAMKSFKTYSSFKSTNDMGNNMASEIALLAELDLESLMKRKRRSSYVRIVSKQMVGIFLTIWVRRSLRRHIQNLKVSTVGVGVMGYIGNKGSISVSMSIYQTTFCFICTHLTSGEKDGDEFKRNADVHEILRRTHFHSLSAIGLPKSIHDHEKIIWLGDLNYRINMSYEKVRDLISKEEWSKLIERDQLVRELRKGRTFDGWSEGALNFAPTYKYELNSEKYYGEDPKVGRRTPSWCDRILFYGKGLRQLRYRRTELKLSDHRPVTAIYMAEVEVFCPRKLQRALTFITDAEIENEEFATEDIE